MLQLDTEHYTKVCYENAKNKGFHPKKDTEREIVSDAHQLLMMIISEIGEALEAYRTGKRANLDSFERTLSIYQSNGDIMFNDQNEAFIEAFEENIKDTFEDELADILIRLFDYYGEVKTSSKLIYLSKPLPISNKYIGESFFFIVKELCSNYCDDLSGFYSMVIDLSESFEIDIQKHIDLKIKYNTTRPYMHGNKKF